MSITAVMGSAGVGPQGLDLGCFGVLESGLIQELHPTAVVAFIGDDSRSTVTMEFGVFNESAHGQG